MVAACRELPAGHGFNALTGEYGDMFDFGIIDPLKVTRSALQSAASIAALLLTTETLIVEEIVGQPGRDLSPPASVTWPKAWSGRPISPELRPDQESGSRGERAACEVGLSRRARRRAARDRSEHRPGFPVRWSDPRPDRAGVRRRRRLRRPGQHRDQRPAGADYRYLLLWTVISASLMAMVVQYLSAKLGLATGASLAEVCRERTSAPVRLTLWLVAELVVIMTDLAEFVGASSR